MGVRERDDKLLLEQIRSSTQRREQGAHLLRPKRAIDADTQQFMLRDGIPVGLDGLSGERPATAIRDGERNHDRQPPSNFFKVFVDGEKSRFGIERVKNRFDQQHVGAPVNQAPGLFVIRFY